MIHYNKLYGKLVFMIPVVVTILVATYTLLYRDVLENLSIISIIAILIFYLNMKHPSFVGLATHATLLFSLSILPIALPLLYFLLLLPMLLSFVTYVFIFADRMEIDVNRWPAASLILLVTSFSGAIMAFIDTRLIITSMLLLSVIVIAGSLIYVELSRRIIVKAPSSISLMEGDIGKGELIIFNHSRVSASIIIVTWSNGSIDLEIPSTSVRGNSSVALPLTIKGAETGLHELYLYIFVEDLFHLTRYRKKVKIIVKVMPKVKIAIAAAYKLLSRIPSEILEHSDTRGLGEIEPIPKMISSRRGEYYGARQYIPGDDLSQIHWKKSLSKGTLISKEMKKTFSYALAIFVDLTSANNKDFSNILYRALTSLILITLKDPLRRVALVLYDLENTYLVVSDVSATKALGELVKVIEEGRIGSYRTFEKTLDRPVLPHIMVTDNTKLVMIRNALIKGIKRKRIWKIIVDVLRGFEGRNIIIIHGYNSLADLYYYLKSMLREKGYIIEEPIELGPRLLYERALTQPIALTV